jgi:hypothetical protein
MLQNRSAKNASNNGHPQFINGGEGNIDIDNELLEQLRLEAKLQIDREKQRTIERELIQNRQSNGNYKQVRFWSGFKFECITTDGSLTVILHHYVKITIYFHLA